MSLLAAPGDREKAALRQLIGARCQSARTSMRPRLSQRALAKHLGMSASWVREVEQGGQFAPWWLVCWLSRVSDTPLDWFCGAGQRDGSPAPERRGLHRSFNLTDARCDHGNHGGWLLRDGTGFVVAEDEEAALTLRTRKQLDALELTDWSELPSG